MGTIAFFKESLKNIKTVGTFTRSSKFVCKAMVKPVDFENAKVIVELGAGDGVITKHILQRMRKDATLLSFEVNAAFCEQMRSEIKDKRLHVIEDSAENLGQHLERLGLSQADYVISAIPFVSLPDDLSYRIVRECHRFMKKDGLYVQIHYSLLMRKMYQTVFGNVDIDWVPLNIPPAFILVSKKR
ncbi:MAG: methyltransferase domain-containing protein [Bacteroidota bacterium]